MGIPVLRLMLSDSSRATTSASCMPLAVKFVEGSSVAVIGGEGRDRQYLPVLPHEHREGRRGDRKRSRGYWCSSSTMSSALWRRGPCWTVSRLRMRLQSLRSRPKMGHKQGCTHNRRTLRHLGHDLQRSQTCAYYCLDVDAAHLVIPC